MGGCANGNTIDRVASSLKIPALFPVRDEAYPLPGRAAFPRLEKLLSAAHSVLIIKIHIDHNNMAKQHALTAHTRKRSGSGALTSLRAEGLIPAVIYGKDIPSTILRLNRKEVETVLHHSVSEHILVELTIEDTKETKLTLLQDVQHNPLNGAILHVDFHAIREDEMIHSTVPLELTGDCVGAKAGGLVEHLVHKLNVVCLPKDLPDAIHLDISNVEIGGALHTKELALPPGVTTHLGAEVVLMLVAAPRVVEVVAAAVVDPKAKKKGKK